MWWKRGVRVLTVLALLTSPLLVVVVYRSATMLPDELVLATGPEGGRYREVGAQLAETIEREYGIRVTTRGSNGSLENLELLGRGEADFAIVQADVGAGFDAREPNGNVRFVSNLYSEHVHVLVRRGVEFESPSDFADKTIAIGPVGSGDHHTSRALLEHLGFPDDVDLEPLDYAGITAGFETGTLDVAFVTTGLRAPMVRDMLDAGHCDLVGLPFAAALAERELDLAAYTIRAGAYRSRTPTEPPDDVQTVSVRAQLVCRAGVPSRAVDAVVTRVLDERFAKRAGLSELFFEGVVFARAKPSLAVHPGARNAFDPSLRPLLDPDFVEASEGIRSFAVSLLIGGVLLYRWWRERRRRAEEHELDRYIRQLLDIERRQLSLNDKSGSSDVVRLQELLDELTRLRQTALKNFTAHELREDRATDCFLEMCHALSDKINAKISRQRIDTRFDELRTTLVEVLSRNPG